MNVFCSTCCPITFTTQFLIAMPSHYRARASIEDRDVHELPFARVTYAAYKILNSERVTPVEFLQSCIAPPCSDADSDS